MRESKQAQIDERTAELIAARVTEAVREDLEAILTGLAHADTSAKRLTVEQVAIKLGLARSTVYSHWREWGGYKLGTGDKAPIRFDANHLPARATAAAAPRAPRSTTATAPPTRRHRRRDLLTDAPRLTQPLDGLA